MLEVLELFLHNDLLFALSRDREMQTQKFVDFFIDVLDIALDFDYPSLLVRDLVLDT